MQWDEKKLSALLAASGETYDTQSVSDRLPKAQRWLTEYNKDAVIELRGEVNTAVWSTVDERNKGYLHELRGFIETHGTRDIKKTEEFLYGLPKKDYTDEKELKKAQRAIFKYTYLLLIGKETGPRLSTFLWSLKKDRALLLLKSPK